MRKAIVDTGLYSQEVADNPHKITTSKTWQELMEYHISDEELAGKHKELLNATRLDHMIFPTGAKDEKERQTIIALAQAKAIEKGTEYIEPDVIMDDDIRQMLKDVNCTVRRIVHGDTARHVYFWSADNKSRKDAVEMGYKLKGRFAPENVPPNRSGNTYNFIFSAPVQERIKAIEAEIKDMLIKPPQQ